MWNESKHFYSLEWIELTLSSKSILKVAEESAGKFITPVECFSPSITVWEPAPITSAEDTMVILKVLIKKMMALHFFLFPRKDIPSIVPRRNFFIGLGQRESYMLCNCISFKRSFDMRKTPRSLIKHLKNIYLICVLCVNDLIYT